MRLCSVDAQWRLRARWAARELKSLDLKSREAAYAALMDKRGSRWSGYSGSTALNTVTKAVDRIAELTVDLTVPPDQIDFEGEIDRIRV